MTTGLNSQIELRAIVAAFGIEALAIERFESGFGGQKWTINCRDNQLFVLKRHERRGFDAARIESARVFVSALEQARIAPIAMATSLGTSYCERESGLYSLATFVTGRSHDRSNLALRSSAVTLAHMHRLGREHAADVPLRKVRSFDALEFLNVQMKALASRTNTSMVSASVCLAEAQQTLHRYESGVIVGPVHGDFHAGNVILQDNGGIVIVDFDSVHFSERAYDVAIAMESFMRDSANWQRLSAFAIEYHQAWVRLV